MDFLALIAAILLVSLGSGLWTMMQKNRDEDAAVIFFRASCAARADGVYSDGTFWGRVWFDLNVLQKTVSLTSPFFREPPMLFRAEADQLIKTFLQMGPYPEEVQDTFYKQLGQAAMTSIALKEKHPFISDRIEEIVIRVMVNGQKKAG